VCAIATIQSNELKIYNFKVILEPDEDFDGNPLGWHVYCPALKKLGGSTWSETREEALKKTLGELYEYERRSRIVHGGQYGVWRREMVLMFFYCTTALALLAISPALAGFKTNADLDGWFKDRMLDGPNHFTPEPPIEAQSPS